MSVEVGKASYMGAMASALSIKSGFAAANKRITLAEAYGSVAAAMGFCDWPSMKNEIASRDDPVALADWSSRGPRIPTVDGSINKKVILGNLFEKQTPLKICLQTDDAYDLVERITNRITSSLVLEQSFESKLYWLLSAILRPLVHLRDKESLPLTFAALQNLLPLDEYLVFAREIVDSDICHQYANPVLRYGVAGSPFAAHKHSTPVSVDEHAILAEIIVGVMDVLEIEDK